MQYGIFIVLLSVGVVLIGANPVNDATDNKGRTLHQAVEEGNKQMVELLIENGANIDAIDINGYTPLHLAAPFEEKLEILELLLEKGAKLNIHNVRGEMPLYSAARKGNVRGVELLIQHGANINDVNNDKETAVFAAIQHGRTEVLKLLIENGADLNLINAIKVTPLYLATRVPKDACLLTEMLIKAGANPNVGNMGGDSALHTATTLGGEKVKCLIEVLIVNGADADFRRADNGETPLHRAVQHQNLEAMKVLMENGATVDAIDTKHGNTPLHNAIDKGSSVVELLLENGANVLIKNKNGKTPEDLAIAKGNQYIIKLIAKYKPKNK